MLEPLVARPWLTGRTSAAVLVRKTDKETSTLLLDESDAAFNGEKEYAEALRGILNSGYRRSGKASLCIGQGANLTYKDFHTFSAKAIAGIGELPGTIADRAIPIQLRRRKTDEPCARWRQRDGHAEAAPFSSNSSAGRATSCSSSCARPGPALPAVNDRKAEVLEPLLAIADVAGGQWPARARTAALALAGADDDTDIVVELLRDLAPFVAASTAALLPTKDILGHLVALDDRPWAAWRHDEADTGRGLARLLGHWASIGAPPAVSAGIGKTPSRTRLPGICLPMCQKRQNANTDGPESPISMCQEPIATDTLKTQVSPIDPACLTL